MALKKLSFNGVSSLELDPKIVIQTPPEYQYPGKDVTTTHVPGRNGDIIVDNGSYKNVTRTYSLGVGSEHGIDFISVSQKLVKWLKSGKGYRRLEDDYDPDVYRLAEYSSDGSFTNIYDGAISFSVDFDCKPQRYLKSGEKELTFTTATFKLTNPTNFTALPKITISGLESISDFGSEILMTFVNNAEKICDITFKDLTTPSITIDSDTQEVYYDETDLASNVNVNDKRFPELLPGETTVEVSKYIRSAEPILSYDDVIKKGQSELDIVYAPYDTVLEQKARKVVIQPFNSKKVAYQTAFYAEAYALLAKDKAKTYEVKDFNETLANQSYSVTCLTDKNETEFISDTGFVKLGSPYSNGKNTVYDYIAARNGFFFCTNDKRWKYVTAPADGENPTDDNIVYKGASESSQISIKFCPAKDATTEMDVKYDDMPDWLTMSIEYNDDNSPKKVVFKTAKDGYYYQEKTGILATITSKLSSNRSNWYLKKKGDTLDYITWSTFKKTFTSTLLSSSSSSGNKFTYKYIDQLPQYEDVYGTTTDSNGNKKKTVVTECPITVAGNVLQPIFKAKKDGWYRVNYSGYKNEDDAAQFTAWEHRTAGEQIVTGVAMNGLDSDTTASNTFYYIADDSVVNYSKSSGWPDWLDPIPVAKDGKPILQSQDLEIKVLEDGKYATLESTSDEDGDIWNEFVDMKKGETIDLGAPDKENTIRTIKEFPTDYKASKNLSFNGKVPENLETPLPWIKFEWIEGKEATVEEKQVDSTYKLYANADGYYKWDTNAEWKKRKSGDVINTNKYSDDTTVYYLERLPDYPENLFYTSSVEESAAGNPLHVTLSVKKEGYYRVDNKTAWSYFKIGDQLVYSDTTTSHILNYLEKDSEGLKGITIKIKPNWWTL